MVYGGIFREEPARALYQGYPHFRFQNYACHVFISKEAKQGSQSLVCIIYPAVMQNYILYIAYGLCISSMLFLCNKHYQIHILVASHNSQFEICFVKTSKKNWRNHGESKVMYLIVFACFEKSNKQFPTNPTANCKLPDLVVVLSGTPNIPSTLDLLHALKHLSSFQTSLNTV